MTSYLLLINNGKYKVHGPKGTVLVRACLRNPVGNEQVLKHENVDIVCVHCFRIKSSLVSLTDLFCLCLGIAKNHRSRQRRSDRIVARKQAQFGRRV